ncbi:MAG: hypothetical protein WC655_15950 [Candidatus Hydrogenedentales bacterium]
MRWRTDVIPPHVVDHIGFCLTKDDVLALNSSIDRRISNANCYDVAELPFRVGLTKATLVEQPEVKGRLSVTYRNFLRDYDAEPGTKIRVGQVEGEILEIRPWAGLVVAPGGPAMARLSWSDPAGEWKSGIVLSDDTWQALDAQTAVYFAWRSSAAEAVASAQAGETQLPQARWGVVDGQEVSWIGSLLPGSGLELSDGTTVTLLEAPEEQAGSATSIQVEIVHDGKTERRAVSADEADPLIRFEDPASHPRLFVVYGWADNRAEARYLERGLPHTTAALDGGFDWRPAPNGPALRLDQVMQAAAYAEPGMSSSYEAVVRVAERTLSVREKERYYLGEACVEFEADVTPPVHDYALTIIREGFREAVAVRSGEILSRNGWKLVLPKSRYDTQKDVKIEVSDERAMYLLYGGLALFTIGGVTMTVAGPLARALRRRPCGDG